MAGASQGSGGRAFTFRITAANAGVVLTGYSSNPRTPRVGPAGVLGSQVRTSSLREVKGRAQGHATGKRQSGDLSPASLAPVCAECGGHRMWE